MQPPEHPTQPQPGWDQAEQAPPPSPWEDEPVQPPVPPRAKRRALPAATAALAIAVAALAGFLVGHRIGVRTTTAGRPTFAAGPGGAGAPGQGQGRRGGLPGGAAAGGGPAGTAGTVKSVEGDTLFLSDADGNTTKVTTSGATSMTKTVPGTLQDIKPGDNVLVQGTRNDDGSYAANRISVGGIGGFFGGFRSGQRGPGAQGDSGAPGGTPPAPGG